MKAAIVNQTNYSLEIKEIPIPTITEGCVLVKLKAASLNHHELWSLQERSLGNQETIILGSDGAGVIHKLGESASQFSVGDEVVINPSINWGPNPRVQGETYEILGHPTSGTFAEYISVPEKYISLKPALLTFEEASALPLAGLTAYRALFTRGEYQQGNKVLITGIGGGAALFALNFALASGAEVFVTSSDDRKIAKAIDLGAKGGVNYKDKNWSQQLRSEAGGFDVIIDSAAGDGFADLTQLANPGGRIVLFGRTAGKITALNPATIFWKQLSIHGTSMGNDEEFARMIRLVSDKKIAPVIDSEFDLTQINDGFSRMAIGNHFGKIIIKFLE
ncbi:NADPH:quinone reductase [Ekhidna lutea]|uniref:NADPH:quinone reductase n=1 Tax=Ekhidna lutea TaxID=447679 RepID=A0A239KK31_EKHLU|nr:zinc-binding dehydrogenase [Ekhidna lutea]SNT18052.1 NADPH:quinone reductase [Ekhidna lutea]